MNVIETINELAAKQIKLIETETTDAIRAIRSYAERQTARLAPKMPNINEPVLVAGIMWGGHLEPSPNCDAPVKFNEDTGLYYFDQKTSAPLHALEQGLRLPTKEQYKQLYDRTTQRDETIGTIKYKVFADKETGAELWDVYGGWYDFDSGEFRNIGMCGCYWSLSVYDANYGYILYFYSGGDINPEYADVRSDGLSVRCVQELAA